MADQLIPKPCPFCQGKSLRVNSSRNTQPSIADHEWWSVSCKAYKCGARGPIMPNEQAAIAAWNARTLMGDNNG